MVFILNENAASRIFEKYKNVAAFGTGKSKGYTDEAAQFTLSYQKLGILPDSDVINGVVNGQISGKKVIKAAVKGLNKVEDDTGLAMKMAQLVNMIKDNANPDTKPEDGESKKAYKKRIRNAAPNALVFVLDGQNAAYDKFVTKYIAALFNEFGFAVITKAKDVKKIFKGNKRKKIVKNVRNFVSNNSGMTLDKHGRRLFKAIRAYYRIELLQWSIAGIADVESDMSAKKLRKYREKKAKEFANVLIDTFSSMNTAEMVNLDLKVNMAKKLMKKNKKGVKSYKVFAELISAVTSGDVKMPKVKFGVTKKSKKKGDPEPAMNTRKFMKFFMKNPDMLNVVFGHLACCYLDVDVGSSEYNKQMTKVIGATEYGADFSKAFVSVAKEYRKAADAPATAG